MKGNAPQNGWWERGQSGSVDLQVQKVRQAESKYFFDLAGSRTTTLQQHTFIANSYNIQCDERYE